MITKITRNNCFLEYPKFPWREYNKVKDEEEDFFPVVFDSHILSLPAKSTIEQSRQLSSELTKLIKVLGYDYWVFLGDNKRPWLTKLSLERNDYKPLRKAIEYLMANKIGKRFNGGLKVDISGLPNFFDHLSCLIRCDASLPYFHFTDKDQNIIGSICQYGNVHIYSLNENADKQFKAELLASRFDSAEDKQCHPSISAIKGLKQRRTYR